MRGTDAELIRWSALVAVFLVVSTAVFCHLEGWSVFDSFYYVFCTSTLVASVFMMIGATLVLSLAANVGQWILDTVTRRRSMRRFMEEFGEVKKALRALGADTSELELELDRIMEEGSRAMNRTEADSLDLQPESSRRRPQ